MSSTALMVLVPVLFVVLLGYAAGRAKAFDIVSIGNPLAGEAVVAAALPSAVIVPMLAGQYGTYQAEADRRWF
jgi:hypothetical protein